MALCYWCVPASDVVDLRGFTYMPSFYLSHATSIYSERYAKTGQVCSRISLDSIIFKDLTNILYNSPIRPEYCIAEGQGKQVCRYKEHFARTGHQKYLREINACKILFHPFSFIYFGALQGQILDHSYNLCMSHNIDSFHHWHLVWHFSISPLWAS